MSDQKSLKTIPTISAAEPLTLQEKDSAQADYESGVEYLNKSDFSMAANAFHNALVGYEQSENSEGVANASDKLGDLCLEREDFDKALMYYDKAYRICKDADDLLSLNSLRKKKAACFHGQKNYSEAMSIYFDMLDYYEKMKDPQAAVDMILKVADIFKEQGDIKNCIDAYKTAASIHTNYNHPNNAAELMAKAEELEKQQ